MLILTRPAIAAIESAMKQSDKADCGVRITAEGGSCSGPKYSMCFEKEPQGEDVVIEIRNVRVFIDEASMEILLGATVDYTQEGETRGFNFTLDPAAKQECGCKTQAPATGSCNLALGGSSCASSAMH